MFSALNYFLTFFTLVAPLTYLLFVIYRFRKELLNSKIVIFLFFIFTIGLFHKLLFFGQTLSAQDFNNIQFPFFEYLRTSLQNYYLVPFWNPNFGGGFDVFSNPLAFYFSTFTWLFYFSKETYLTFNIYLAFQIFLTGVFSFLMLREVGFKKYSSLIGAMVLTFNGFVIMRLAPGIGTEYLFSYKWLPLIILFSFSVFKNLQKKDWIFLALSLGFVFEGNTNIAIAIWILWGVLILFITNLKFFSHFKDILKISFFALAIFAIKFLPGVDLMINSPGRISEVVTGWRVTRVSIERIISYFLPLKDSYLAGPFTPGLVGFIIFFLGFLLVIYFIFLRRKILEIQIFGFISLILGLFFTSAGSLSDYVFSLPLLNRLTINPSFYIFLLLPIGIFAASLINFVYERYSKYENYFNLLFLGVCFLIFIEILLGPSTFGKGSYSFNFNKMEISEVEKYPVNKFLLENTKGNFVFLEEDELFLLPNSVQLNNQLNLNRSDYFYGTSYFKDLSLNERLPNYKIRAENIISTRDLDDKDLQLIGKIDMREYLKDFDSNSILVIRNKYFKYIKETGWDEYLRVYKVSENIPTKSLVNYSNHPNSISFLLNENNILDNDLVTSISYSKHWVVTNSGGEKLTTEKDSNGLMIIKNVKPYENIFLNYINIYIYLGFLISLVAFCYFVYKFYKFEIKNS